MKLEIVSRKTWLALPPCIFTTVPNKLKFIFLEYTNSDHVHSLEEGMKAVLRMQDIDLHYHGKSDIKYNFIVSTDGTVFEGRGWGREAHLKPRECKDKTPFILIGLMWNYSELQKDAPRHMMGSKDKLIELGKELRHIHPAAEETIKYH